MIPSPSPSVPPRGTRVSAPVAHLFRVPLPRYSELEIARVRALLRRQRSPKGVRAWR